MRSRPARPAVEVYEKLTGVVVGGPEMIYRIAMGASHVPSSVG
ncbi:hypothetical protein I553_5551 [Mycobacterium xenopi 4042]|uniref:Uncharacterized protein n=1 Tax=Mycobacterium xenopi 4042 TaxID=1299334 RepID=X7ZVP0_MYCXE|nr:hypothetical protein I553_5551 [Mycobacterium xenopi 4042]